MNIYIDVGHGGSDTTGSDVGASGKLAGKTYYENECNLQMALAARDKLKGYGLNVTLSRDNNSNKGVLVGKYNRADSNLINSAYACRDGNYDLMVSIHNNDSDNAAAHGYQLIYKTGDGCKDESFKMANYIAECLDAVITKNAIYQSVAANGKDNYGILRLHNKKGVLIEGLFMSNEQDMALLADKDMCKRIGEAIANGIAKYLGKDINPKKDETNYEEAYKILNEQYGELEAKYSELYSAYVQAKDELTALKSDTVREEKITPEYAIEVLKKLLK